MIDFRYHLVSIVAIFLALTVGIVLGSTVLAKPVNEIVQGEVQNLQRENDRLAEQKTQQNEEIKGYNELVTKNAVNLVGGLLKDERVVVIESPGADEAQRGEIDAMIKASGAELSGRVTLLGKFLDANEESTLEKLTEALRPSDVTFAENSSPFARAGALLGYSVLTKEESESGSEAADGADVIAGLEEAEYINAAGKNLLKRATLAVMVAPDAPDTDEEPTDGALKETTRKSANLLETSTGLDGYARGLTIGGNLASAAPEGLIGALRASSMTSKISSVDSIYLTAGRVVLIYALNLERDERTGQYGTGPDASSGFLPKTPPVPSPTRSGGN